MIGRVLQCVGMFARDGERAGLLVSDYPLLLLHVRVGLRRREEAEQGGDDAAPGVSADGASFMSARARELAEARKLGDELERLLG